MSLINVKVQFIGISSKESSKVNGNGSLIHKFSPSASINDVLIHFEKGIQASSPEFKIFNREVTHKLKTVKQITLVQIANKRVSSSQDLAKSLTDYGFDSGSCLLRISFQNMSGTVATKPTEEPKVTSAATKKEETKEIINNEVKKDHQPSYEIYKPSESKNPLATGADDDGDLEMSVDDARKYQQILKGKANAKSEYVMAKLKKKEEEKKLRSKNEEVKDVNIRVKFPDLSLTQLKFTSVNTIKDMILFFQNKILLKEFKYNLVIPNFNYNNTNRGKLGKAASVADDNIYWKDIKSVLDGHEGKAPILGQKLAHYNQASFIFELIIPGSNFEKDKLDYKIDSTYRGPFIRNEKSAQAINKLVDAKESHSSVATTLGGKLFKRGVGESSSKSSSETKKVPKWLKLSKK